MKDKVIGVRLSSENVEQIKQKIGDDGSISKYIRWLINVDMGGGSFDKSVCSEERAPKRTRKLDLGDHGPVDIPMVASVDLVTNEPLSLRDGD